MQSVTATVEPQTSLTTWIDQSDPRKAWFQVGDDVGAQTFQIRVAQAQARTGIALQKPVIFKLQTPPKPRFVDPPQNPVTLKYGDSFTIKSSLELTGVQVTTSDPSLASVAIDKSAIRVTLPRYQQGAAFDVSVPSAASLQGAPLAEPLNLHFVTPPAMDVPSIAPDDGTVGVQPNAHPAIEFPEPVADQGVATQALQMDPQVAGRWQWTSPTRVEFVPDTRLPILSDITVSLRGGPDGPRNAAGGYLADDVSATFRTTDFKRMDVSLGRQTMTLFENDVAVRTIYVATGVAAAPTPTGTFYVQYKSPQMRFRGVNPDGSHYDIPDVHWVMPFWGDYTIHGAYWRPRFGVPGSDGCISMTDGDAKMLFDWADVGTPVVIHS
jgi:lipoprotein-anchoring transpeptidase ErfK/SrfK